MTDAVVAAPITEVPHDERRAAGLEILAQCFGADYAAHRPAGINAFNAPLRAIVEEFAFGTIWTRPGLPHRMRSLLCLVILASLNRSKEMRLHVVSALNNGSSVEEIREVLLHLVPYAGIPAAVEAFRVAEEVLAEQGRLRIWPDTGHRPVDPAQGGVDGGRSGSRDGRPSSGQVEVGPSRAGAAGVLRGGAAARDRRRGRGPLRLPQSSASGLIATLLRLGYLDHAPDHPRRYAPTLRVTLLGSWLHDSLFGWGSLLSVMEDLRRRTGATVILGMQRGTEVQYILVLRGETPSRAPLHVGALRPLHRAALGKVLLAAKPAAEQRRLVRAANARHPSLVVAEVLAMAELRDVRRQGWAESHDLLVSGVGAIAVPVSPPLPGQPPLSVGLGGYAARLGERRDDLLLCAGGLVERLSTVERERRFKVITSRAASYRLPGSRVRRGRRRHRPSACRPRSASAARKTCS